MNAKLKWISIASKHDYETATARYEEIKRAPKGSDKYKEKLLLVTLISEYEKAQWDLPELDPVELNEIWMKDYGENA